MALLVQLLSTSALVAIVVRLSSGLNLNVDK